MPELAVELVLVVDQGDEINDELKVRLLDEWRREDAEIRGIALQILMWDLEVPAESVDVKVDEGWITLTGNVSYQFESEAAYDDVTGLYGVYGVTNEVTVSRPLSMSTRAGARLRRLHVGGYTPGVARAGPAASRYSREV